MSKKSEIALLSLLGDLQEETKKTVVDWNLAQNYLNNTLLLWQEILQIEKDSVKILTEINRSLRLLETDMLLLRSARSSDTSSKRLFNFQQRLEQVIGYCKLILVKDE